MVQFGPEHLLSGFDEKKPMPLAELRVYTITTKKYLSLHIYHNNNNSFSDQHIGSNEETSWCAKSGLFQCSKKPLYENQNRKTLSITVTKSSEM